MRVFSEIDASNVPPMVRSFSSGSINGGENALTRGDWK